jgi:hypothetical protein
MTTYSFKVRKQCRIHIIKGLFDILQDDGHDHDPGQHIQQDAEFNDMVGTQWKTGAHQVDAVFHHDIAQHHGDGVAPGHEQNIPATSNVMAVGSSRALTLVWGTSNDGWHKVAADDQQQPGQDGGMVADDGLHLAANGDFFDGQVNAQRDDDPRIRRVAMVKMLCRRRTWSCPMKRGTMLPPPPERP